jgi:hypothetical protein
MHHKAIASILLLMELPLSSAGQVLHWANVLGVSGESMIQEVRTDAQDNIYVFGRMANTGSVDLDPGPGSATLSWNFGGLPGSGYFLAKYDSSGTYQWGLKLDALRAIAVSPAGDVVLSMLLDGSWDADPGPGTYMVSGNGMALVRWSTNGTFVAASVIEGSIAMHLLTNDQGDVFLLGQFTNSIDVDPGPNVAMLNSSGYSDVWVAKFNAMDQLEWSGAMGGVGMEYACDLAFSEDDLLLTLRTVGPVPMQQFDVDPGSDTAWTALGQNQGAVAVQLDPAGGYMRHAGFDWPVWWQSPLIRPLPDRGIVLGGAFSGQATFSNADTVLSLSSSGMDAFIHTLEGTIWQPGWSDLFSAYGNELISCMTPFKDGAVVVSGTFTHSLDADPGSGSIVYQTQGPPSTAWIGSYCLDDGSHIWSTMVQGTDRDWFMDMNWSAADALVIGGQCSDSANIGLVGPPALVSTSATSSAIVARYRAVNTSCVGSGVFVPELARPDLVTFIVGDLLVVEGLAPGEELRLLDGLGRLLEHQMVSSARMELSMSGRSPGVYIVLARSTMGGRTKRLVHHP